MLLVLSQTGGGNCKVSMACHQKILLRRVWMENDQMSACFIGQKSDLYVDYDIKIMVP